MSYFRKLLEQLTDGNYVAMEMLLMTNGLLLIALIVLMVWGIITYG
jgi:hypothetical protein